MELIKRNTDYALRVLTAMGKAPGKVFQAADLSRQGDVPLVFLHKILQKLTRGGLLKSSRGRYNGGFSLTPKALTLTLQEVIQVMQGDFALNRCFVSRNGCSRVSSCKIHRELFSLQKDMEEILKRTTLRDLVRAKGN